MTSSESDESTRDWRASADEQLDTSGTNCPDPLTLLRNRVRALAAGARLHVIATDPASKRDFEQFCSFLGHRIVEREENDARFEFLIEKAAP